MNISEVSNLTGFSIDTLRYYEKIGIIRDVKRSSSGKREYDQQNINHLTFVCCMKKAGCSLDVIKQYMSLYDQGQETVDKRVTLLESQKQLLIEAIQELEASIEYLDTKIEYTKKIKNN